MIRALSILLIMVCSVCVSAEPAYRVHIFEANGDDSWGTAAAIGKRRLLTAGHCAPEGVRKIQIEVEKEWRTVTVERVDHEADLALLAVDFDLPAFAELSADEPDDKASITVYGSPEAQAITEYKGHCSGELGDNRVLDVRIKQGCSGSPVLCREKTVGVAIALVADRQWAKRHDGFCVFVPLKRIKVFMGRGCAK